jgi:hypothetical protein
MQLPATARLGTCHKMAWNVGSDRQIAVAYGDNVAVLDLRQEYTPMELLTHTGRVRDLGWATHDRSWLCVLSVAAAAAAARVAARVSTAAACAYGLYGLAADLTQVLLLPPLQVHLRRRRQRIHVGHRQQQKQQQQQCGRGRGGGGGACLCV